jgi:hypothetical protein
MLTCKYLYVFKTKIKVISKKKQQPKTAHMILITFKVKKQFQEKEELQAKLTEYEKYKDKCFIPQSLHMLHTESAYLWVQTVLLFSPTCSFIRMRQTSYRGFSRKTKRS